MALYVQFGSGLSAPDGWRSYDYSPTLLIERTPFLRRLKGRPLFPAATLYGDIVRGLPERQGAAQGVFASHVLEHLTRADCLSALRNTFEMLTPGGVFRLVVPDLEGRAHNYLNGGNADSFMRDCIVGTEERDNSIIGRLRSQFGGNHHLWMWDRHSMAQALGEVGFVAIRPCIFGDSDDPMFKLVEDETRFYDANLGLPECAMEGRKPPTPR